MIIIVTLTLTFSVNNHNNNISHTWRTQVWKLIQCKEGVQSKSAT